MKFHFRYFLGKLPLLDAELAYSDKKIRLSALLDTGADYSVFSRGVAQKLNIPLEKGELKVLEGAGGTIVAYRHSVKLKLCGKEIHIKACFCEKESSIPENILGRRDVIDHFKVLFDKNNFTLLSPDEV